MWRTLKRQAGFLLPACRRWRAILQQSAGDVLVLTKAADAAQLSEQPSSARLVGVGDIAANLTNSEWLADLGAVILQLLGSVDGRRVYMVFADDLDVNG